MEKREDEQGKDFANPANAEKWDEYEVVRWLEDIGFVYEPIGRRFKEEAVDGNTLMHDMTETILTMDLG